MHVICVHRTWANARMTWHKPHQTINWSQSIFNMPFVDILRHYLLAHNQGRLLQIDYVKYEKELHRTSDGGY